MLVREGMRVLTVLAVGALLVQLCVSLDNLVMATARLIEILGRVVYRDRGSPP